MNKVHLPEDIGGLAEKLGKKEIGESYSASTSESELVAYVGVFPPNNDEERENPIFKPASENVTDVFALSRIVRSQVLFEDVSNYDLDPAQWSFQVADTVIDSPQGLNQLSVVWSFRVQVRAFYPGALSEVRFSPSDSSIEIACDPVNSNLGQQQALLFSNRVFNATVSPIFVTMAVKMTLSQNISCQKTWGWLGGNAGYFFRIRATGQSDNFMIGYRFTLGGTVREIEIPRSKFNGDKLDGNTHTQTFTNIGMFGVEVGTAGFGARFWVFVTVNNGLPRWVLVHSLKNDSDSSQSRLIDEESLPFSFEILNLGVNPTRQTLAKFGTSVASIGDFEGNGSLNFAENNLTTPIVRGSQALIGIRASDSVVGRKNFNSVLVSQLNLVLTGTGIKTINIIRRPPSNLISDTWESPTNLSGIQINTTRTGFITGGKLLASYLLGKNPLSVFLKEVFALNRSFLTAKYTNDPQENNDFGNQFSLGSDEVWVTVDDAYLDVELDYVIWDINSLTQSEPTYAQAGFEKYESTFTTIHANINTLDI